MSAYNMHLKHFKVDPHLSSYKLFRNSPVRFLYFTCSLLEGSLFPPCFRRAVAGGVPMVLVPQQS